MEVMSRFSGNTAKRMVSHLLTRLGLFAALVQRPVIIIVVNGLHALKLPQKWFIGILLQVSKNPSFGAPEIDLKPFIN